MLILFKEVVTKTYSNNMPQITKQELGWSLLAVLWLIHLVYLGLSFNVFMLLSFQLSVKMP